MTDDRKFMLEALALARLGWGRTNPNPMVGAVIVRDGEIIGRGYHQKAGCAHAEVNAIKDMKSRNIDGKGATIYVTLEPCSSYGRTPPCTGAIIENGFSRVVIGTLDPNPKHNGKAVELLRSHGIEVEHGIENDACYDLNRPFFCWVTTGKPLVMLKMAMTLDGKIATVSGDSKWVTGSAARSRVQELRQLCGAVIVGAETVRCDHPQLTVREPENWENQPLRVVASSSFTQRELEHFFPDGNACAVDLNSSEKWDKFLLELGSKNITAVLIEGGGVLAGNALQNQVVDYVEFHIAPKLLAGTGRPVVAGMAPELMSQALKLRDVEVKTYGEDIAVCGYLKNSR